MTDSQAVLALRATGFARIFFRNAINLGLSAITHLQAGEQH